MHRTPTCCNNAQETGIGSSKAGEIYSSNDKKVYESTDPTDSRRLSRFMIGRLRRTGVVRRQDEALTVDQLLLIGDIYEKDRVKSNSEEGKKKAELITLFATIAFFLSLKWEEVPLIIIQGLNMFWNDTWNYRITHMMMTLKGIPKGENNPWWYCVPLVDQNKSGITTRRWISRILYCQCKM